MHYLLWLSLGLVVLTSLLRVQLFLYLAFLLLALYFLGQQWVKRGLRRVSHRRRYVQRAFLGERVPVSVEIVNNGYLPLPWLRVTDSLPIELHSPSFSRGILSLYSKERGEISYELHAQRRGYYRVGPIQITAGDLFGVTEVSLLERETAADHFIVYPRIVPLKELGLPSQLPYGTVRSTQRIFEDPSHIVGARDYQAGDSLKRINWKTSAVTGKLQVKRYSPAIALETAIFLNLSERDYSSTYRWDAAERAIVVTASIAVHTSEGRQAVGLATNGMDPLGEIGGALLVPPRRGREHLLGVLDILARIEAREGADFPGMLLRQSINLPWGCTIVVVTPTDTGELLPRLVQLRRRGFSVRLILVDPQGPFAVTKRRAQQVGIQAYRITSERDLDVWR